MTQSQKIRLFFFLFLLVINLGLTTSRSQDSNPNFVNIEPLRNISNQKKSSANIDFSQPNWSDIRFRYRKKVSIHADQVIDDLINFPVLIDLYDIDLKNHAQPIGNDIIFTDDKGTKLAHEIEMFERNYNSTHSHLVAWVRTNLTAYKDTNLFMYYGNVSIERQATPEDVWDNNFTCVWHLSEVQGTRYDSTGNNIDSSPQNFENDEASVGKIAGADALDGTDDFIETYTLPDELELGGKSARTVSAWVYTNNFDGGGLFEFGQHATKGLFSLQTHSSDNLWIGNWWGDNNTFNYPSLNAWVYLTVVYDGTTVYIYANSELQINSSKNLNTGNKITIKIGSSNGKCFTGLIDEMRFSTIARSAAWIQTEFLNQFDPNSFYSISTEQTDNNSPSITDFGVNSDQKEQLTFYATAIDDFTSVEMVTIEINGSLYSMAKNESEVWVYQYSPVNFGDYFIFRITNASDSFGNYMNASSNEIYYKFTIDFAPPQVLQAYFIRNDRLNPTSLTFYAEIKESGSGIEDIILFYHFEEVIEGDEIAGSGSTLLQETESQWVQKKMSMLNESSDISIYSTTVPFVQNKTTWKVLYRVKTADKYGNIDENAFIVNSEQVEEDKIIYSPKDGVIPIDFSFIMLIVFFNLVLLILGITVVSSIYVRYFRKPVLVGLDRNLVEVNLSQVSEDLVKKSSEGHTLGLVLSFFNESAGPVPLVVIPMSLDRDSNLLLKVAMRSFSNCEFADNFEEEKEAIFNFTYPTNTTNLVLKSLTYSFALNRPTARNGAENFTLSILLYPKVYPIISHFTDLLIPQIYKIHCHLDKNPNDHLSLINEMYVLRKLISKIILSYSEIYGYEEYC
ncbi:MAG: DUF2341 domain-containing protein [Candidatus Hodarchaeota archaeon]